MAKKRLLYITAFSLTQFGGVVRNGIEIYEKAGLDVDLLTLYGFPGQKSNHFSVYPRTREMMNADLRRKIADIPLLKSIYRFFYPLKKITATCETSKYLRSGDIAVVLEDESKPVVSNELILSKITKEYDYFLLYGWQDMMSAATVEAIYDKFHKPIMIACADMYQFTGNCFYTADCDKYQDECWNCPVFAERLNKDQAHKNFLFKKRVYEKTGCYITVNSHQKKYLLQSGIINEEQILNSVSTINTDLYKPLSVEACRKKFGVKQDKVYLLVRYIYPDSPEYSRKGMFLLDQSLKTVYSSLSKEERSRVVVMFAGVKSDMCSISYDFETIAIGILDIKNLIIAYNAASFFVCPSVDDAGPSMVVQSIACGTPVVAYDQGVALDVIEDGYNGFKAKVGDYEEYAHCILRALRLSKTDYAKMRENAREMSIRKTSYEAKNKQTRERLAYIDSHFKG